MKRILLVLLVLCSQQGFTQDATDDFDVINATIEELYEKLESDDLAPRLEVNIRNEFAHRLRNDDYDGALEFATDALSLAEKIEYDKGISDANMRFGAVENRLGNYDKAINHYRVTLEYRLSQDKTASAASTCNSIGIAYKNLGRFEEAIRYFNQGIQLIGEQKPVKRRATLYNNKAISLRYLGRYEEAIIYFDSSLQVKRSIPDSSGVAITHLDLAHVHTKLGNFEKAEELLKSALAIFEAKEENDKTGKVNLELGNLEFARQNYSAARGFYEKAVGSEGAISENTLLTLKQNIGTTYLHEGQPALARQYYDSCLQELRSKNIDNPYLRASLLYQLGKAYQAEGDYDSAQISFENVLEESEGLENLQVRSNTYLHLSDLYALAGVYDQAYSMGRKADSLWDQTMSGKIAAIYEQQSISELKMEDRIDAGILQLSFERAIHEGQLTKLSIVILLIIVIAMITIRQVQIMKEQAEQEIDDLLRDQANQAQDARLKGQDQERKRIAQDLHDGLGSMLATVKLYFTGLDEKLDVIQQESREHYQKASTLLDEACQEVRRISHDMEARELTNGGGLPAQLAKMLGAIKESQQIEVELKLFRFEDRLPGLTEGNIYRIIQELVSNVLKHAKATRLIVALTKFEHMVNVQVEDNGRGFKPNERNDKAGIGLDNVRNRVKLLGGEINIDSVLDRGTAVSVDIPLDLSNVPEDQY